MTTRVYKLYRYGVCGLVSARSKADASRIVEAYHGEKRKIGKPYSDRSKIELYNPSQETTFTVAAKSAAEFFAGKVIPEYN